ncbi:MAG TPA: serine/threonine-protein kinase [Caulobacteraceae bacterium]
MTVPQNSPPPDSSWRSTFVPRAGPESGADGGVAIGSVLNHIYEVRRFIARGGMGEVYEGVNVNTDERVAIKVILPHLAQDPKIQAMFRKEARTLTRLTHPALVQYRVLAQEPSLGVIYIVTEFVDGCGLDEVIGEIAPNEAELRGLTRRLAEGLRAAHALGAIHRDISPDNVLLPGGRLDAAKIIDFGIAKDLETTQATIVGEAFVGKLGFVAPEQFGDFSREIGPWTDVYSLGLVILAIAADGELDMGVTLVEAVDRRRAGPDLSPLPEDLRPVFARMLQADPATRFRSMDEVISALDATIEELEALPPLPPPTAPYIEHAPPRGGLSSLAVIGVSISALIVTAGLIVALVARRDRGQAPGPPQVVGAQAEATMDAALRSAPCAWLTDRMSRGTDGLHIEMNGAAADPAGAVAHVTQALQKADAPVAAADRSQLRLLPAAACEAISAVAKLHAPTSEVTWVRAQAVVFHVQPSPICGGDPRQAVSVVTVRSPPPGQEDDIALFRVEDTGAMTRIFSGLTEFRAMAQVPAKAQATTKAKAKGYLFEDLGPQGLRVSVCEKTGGLKGALVVRGKPPFDLGLPPMTSGDAASSPGLAARIAEAGKAQGWRTQMAWYEIDTTPLPAQSPVKVASLRRAIRRGGASANAKSMASASPPAATPPAKDKPDTLGTDFR